MRYLVATDGSPQGDAAVAYAATRAAAFDAQLEIVHVLTSRTRSVDGEAVLEDELEGTETGEAVLERATSIAREAVDKPSGTLEVSSQLLTGRPASAIADHAAEIGADAIFTGHRGLSSKREELVGSVAKGVVDEAAVPVTIVR